MGERFMAMLALERPAHVTAEQVIEQVGKRFPENRIPFSNAAPKGEGGADAPLMLKVGDILVTAMFIDQPIPADSLAEPIAVNKVWPEAAAQLGAHKAHIIVGTLDEAEGHGPCVDHAAVVTVVTAAIASMTPAIGVYWSNGRTVTETSRFVRAAERLIAGRPPAEIWVQLLWLDGPMTPARERTLAVVTTGLAPFVGREVEFMPAPLPPAVIADRTLGTLTYLLTRGPVLKDGDSLGVSEKERIRATYAAQGYKPGVPVMQLRIEALDEPRPRAANSGGR
jgi:hypothetical protein